MKEMINNGHFVVVCSDYKKGVSISIKEVKFIDKKKDSNVKKAYEVIIKTKRKCYNEYCQVVFYFLTYIEALRFTFASISRSNLQNFNKKIEIYQNSREFWMDDWASFDDRYRK